MLTSAESPASNPRRRTGQTVVICLALALGALLIFGQAVRYGFIGFDDDRYVDHNPALEAGLSVRGLVWALTTNLTHLSETAEYWEPLTLLTRLADYQAYRFQPWGHHLTSVLIHLATTLALFGALQKLTGRYWRSALVAALFLVHPMHVEPVLWLSARKDLVNGFFYVLTLWAYGAYGARPNWRRYWLVLAAALATNMSKPMGVSLPFVLLLLDVWPLRRWPAGEENRVKGAWLLVREKLPVFVLTFGVAVLAIVVQRDIGAVDELDPLPLSLRLGNAALSVVIYVAKAFVPVKLAFFYPHPGRNLNVTLAVVAALVVLLITGAVLGQWRRRPWLTIGWYWFLVVLAPVLGLIQVGDQAMADRYSYIAFIGLFVAVVWQAAEWFEKAPVPNRGKFAGALAAGVLGIYATLCFRQVQTWRSNESLFTHALAVTTGNYVAEYNLGVTLWAQGQREAAMHHFQEAVRIRKPVLQAQIAAANAAAERGAYREAIPRLTRVLLIMPWNSELHQRLGTWLALDHQAGKALMQFDQALKYQPTWAQPRLSIAAVMMEEGEFARAAAVLKDVLSREPANAQAKEMLDTLQKHGPGRAE